MIGGVLASVATFSIYALFLGGIDGLPPFPIEYLPAVDDPKGPGNLNDKPPADRDLELAYGAGCEELRRPYRLWLPEKGIALAAGQFDIEQADGRAGQVRLAPFSVALFHKRKVPGAYTEISTIKCDAAYLTQDRTVSNMSELTNRKVIGVELKGRAPGVSLTNNR